jgi:hypothetical protein
MELESKSDGIKKQTQEKHRLEIADLKRRVEMLENRPIYYSPSPIYPPQPVIPPTCGGTK